MPNKYPIQETDARKAYRERAGLTQKVTVDARAFKNAFEHDHQESLAWNPKRVDNLRELVNSGIKINAHPEVGIDAFGRLGVNDGRHRIAHAAEIGNTIDVVAHPDDVDKIRSRISKQEYIDQASKLLKS